MRIVRFADQKESGRYGILEGDSISGIQGDPFTQFEGAGTSFKLDGSTCRLDEVRLLAPSTPSKVCCVGLNFRSAIADAGVPIPEVPVMFIKPSTAVIGPGDDIVLPDSNRRVNHEGELGVIIGKKAKDVTEEEALDYILGYTCHNDVTDVDVLEQDGIGLTRGKGFDTFSSLGPWIETELDPRDVKIETYVNGELRQSGRTTDLIVGIAGLVSFISGVMTLLPGDVISSGTPAGNARMVPGDIVEVTIENIGTQRNPVVARG